MHHNLLHYAACFISTLHSGTQHKNLSVYFAVFIYSLPLSFDVLSGKPNVGEWHRGGLWLSPEPHSPPADSPAQYYL